MSDPTPSPTPVAATEPVIDAAAIATATAEAEAEAAAAAAEYQANTNLLVACTQGKLEDIKVLVEAKADVCFQDKDSGLSPLMVASQAGNIEIVKYILGRGAPWNALDINGMCAGDYAGNAMASGDDDAAKAKQLDCYEELVNAGCRAELVLGMMKRVKAHMAKPPAKRGRDGDSKGDEKEASNADYLQQKLKYSEGKLLDANDDAVMMGWEGPLMEQHAALICAKGGDVLNVGFGLGLIDMAIQKHNPKNHHIIEAHPDVYQHMLDQGWDKKDNVTIHFGR